MRLARLGRLLIKWDLLSGFVAGRPPRSFLRAIARTFFNSDAIRIIDTEGPSEIVTAQASIQARASVAATVDIRPPPVFGSYPFHFLFAMAEVGAAGAIVTRPEARTIRGRGYVLGNHPIAVIDAKAAACRYWDWRNLPCELPVRIAATANVEVIGPLSIVQGQTGAVVTAAAEAGINWDPDRIVELVTVQARATLTPGTVQVFVGGGAAEPLIAEADLVSEEKRNSDGDIIRPGVQVTRPTASLTAVAEVPDVGGADVLASIPEGDGAKSVAVARMEAGEKRDPDTGDIVRPGPILTRPTSEFVAEAQTQANAILIVPATMAEPVNGVAWCETVGARIRISIFCLAKAETAAFAVITLPATNVGQIQNPDCIVWEEQTTPWAIWDEPWDSDCGQIREIRGFEGVAEAFAAYPMPASASIVAQADTRVRIFGSTPEAVAEASAAGATLTQYVTAPILIEGEVQIDASLYDPNTLFLLNLDEAEAPWHDRSKYAQPVVGLTIPSSSSKFGPRAGQFVGSRVLRLDNSQPLADLTFTAEIWVRAFGTNLRTLFNIDGVAAVRVEDGNVQLLTAEGVQSAPITLGEFEHIALTRSADNTLQVFVSGTSQISQLVSGNLNGASVIYLGNGSNVGSEPGNVILDDFRLRVNRTDVVVPTSAHTL